MGDGDSSYLQATSQLLTRQAGRPGPTRVCTSRVCTQATDIHPAEPSILPHSRPKIRGRASRENRDHRVVARTLCKTISRATRTALTWPCARFGPPLLAFNRCAPYQWLERARRVSKAAQIAQVCVSYTLGSSATCRAPLGRVSVHTGRRARVRGAMVRRRALAHTIQRVFTSISRPTPSTGSACTQPSRPWPQRSLSEFVPGQLGPHDGLAQRGPGAARATYAQEHRHGDGNVEELSRWPSTVRRPVGLDWSGAHARASSCSRKALLANPDLMSICWSRGAQSRAVRGGNSRS